MHKSMPKFYDYNGQKYSICFPIEWATTHFEKTGPLECINCLHYGCTDDVFTTYCINCQEYEYNFTRVPGNNSINLKVHDTIFSKKFAKICLHLFFYLFQYYFLEDQ